MTATATIHQVLAHLRSALTPNDVFGPTRTPDDLARAYRRAAKTCHPDLHPALPQLAEQAFILLTRWHRIAQTQLRTMSPNATPSSSPTRRHKGPILLQHKHHTYEVEPDVAFAGNFANLYRALHNGAPVAVKIARRPRDNDLLFAERTALHRIAARVDSRHHPYFPRLIDTFTHTTDTPESSNTTGLPRGEQRATNVLSWIAGAYTLDEIRRAYPTGIDPRDVAWIWRRLLVALGAAHRAGIVHGAVLPPHICVLPEEHGLVLVGWTCAVETGSLIPAISAAHEHWYPKEVLSKEPSTPATDVALGARSMLFLLGPRGTRGTSGPGGPRGSDAPMEDAPAALSRFFRGCMLPSPRQRPQDAWELLREFDDLLARLWGNREFRPFSVPAPCPR